MTILATIRMGWCEQYMGWGGGQIYRSETQCGR